MIFVILTSDNGNPAEVKPIERNISYGKYCVRRKVKMEFEDQIVKEIKTNNYIKTRKTKGALDCHWIRGTIKDRGPYKIMNGIEQVELACLLSLSQNTIQGDSQ